LAPPRAEDLRGTGFPRALAKVEALFYQTYAQRLRALGACCPELLLLDRSDRDRADPTAGPSLSPSRGSPTAPRRRPELGVAFSSGSKGARMIRIFSGFFLGVLTFACTCRCPASQKISLLLWRKLSPAATNQALQWLARLHAEFWGVRAEDAVAAGLHDVGCFWSLDNCRDQLSNLPQDGFGQRLLLAADAVDERLKLELQSICHGDCKGHRLLPRMRFRPAEFG